MTIPDATVDAPASDIGRGEPNGSSGSGGSGGFGGSGWGGKWWGVGVGVGVGVVGVWTGVVLFGMGWSERLLAPVRVGMGVGEVRRVVGEPVGEWRVAGGGVCWSFTRWWSADAEVYFDEAGRVRAVVTD